MLKLPRLRSAPSVDTGESPRVRLSETGDAFTLSAPAEEMPLGRFSRETRIVYHYWCGLRDADHRTPSRSDFDPIDIPAALPYISLWEVLEGGQLIRCRLAGTTLCRLAGRELRGLTVEQMSLHHPETAKAEFVGVVETGNLHYVERGMEGAPNSYNRYDRLLLPLTGADGKIAFLIAVVRPHVK